MAQPAGSKSQKSPRPLGRYDVNLLLFLLLVVGLTLWFWLHLKPVVTEISMLGGTVSLVAIWKSLRSWFDWAGDRDAQSFTRSFLGTRWATEYLALGLFLLAALYVSTSSIYLVYEGAAAGEAEFQVEVYDENGNPYLEPLTVRSSDRLVGRPFFFTAGAPLLEFRIVDPPGYQPLDPRRFFMGRPVRVRVPADFKEWDRAILRIVPDIELANQLPEVRDWTEPTHQLVVAKQGGAPALADFRRQTVYTGASEKDLRWFVSHHDSDAFREELLRHLAFKVPTERHERQWLARWLGPPRLLAGGPFSTGDQISIQVEDLADSTVISETTLTLRGNSSDGIETVLLKAKPGSQ